MTKSIEDECLKMEKERYSWTIKPAKTPPSSSKSHLDVDRCFQHPLFEKKRPTVVLLTLNPPSIGKSGTETHSVLVEITSENIKLSFPENKEEAYEWVPKTHMRTFDLIEAFTGNQITIRRGQGIGVIIDEAHGTYLKLMYDCLVPGGVGLAVFAAWDRSPISETVLHKDLQMGYSVFVLSCGLNEDIIPIDLSEESDERDKIWLSKMHPLSNLENYVIGQKVSTRH